VGFTDGSYFRYSKKKNNFKNSIGGSLNTADFITSCILFWEFSWGLFNISIEVEERLSRQQHWLKKQHRNLCNVIVLVLIFICFILAAIITPVGTQLPDQIILVLFLIFTSVIYLWTLANIS